MAYTFDGTSGQYLQLDTSFVPCVSFWYYHNSHVNGAWLIANANSGVTEYAGLRLGSTSDQVEAFSHSTSSVIGSVASGWNFLAFYDQGGVGDLQGAIWNSANGWTVDTSTISSPSITAAKALVGGNTSSAVINGRIAHLKQYYNLSISEAALAPQKDCIFMPDGGQFRRTGGVARIWPTFTTDATNEWTSSTDLTVGGSPASTGANPGISWGGGFTPVYVGSLTLLNQEVTGSGGITFSGTATTTFVSGITKLYPTSVVSAGTYTRETGSSDPADLIDGVEASDSYYIRSELLPATTTIKFGLTSMLTRTGIKLAYEYGKDITSNVRIDQTIQLVKGGSVVRQAQHQDVGVRPQSDEIDLSDLTLDGTYEVWCVDEEVAA